ncbi:MAG: hypothetical protein FWC43_06240 [Planctomycetaceae bacterium]|nr:hypothetical protein [Planctomycetaceae bacterium]
MQLTLPDGFLILRREDAFVFFRRFLTVCSLLVLVAAVAGCASRVVETRLQKVATDPLEKKRFRLTSQGDLAFSEHTTLTLRAYDIESTAKTEPVAALVSLQKLIERNPNPNLLYAFAEIAYFEAQRWERDKPKLALEIYYAALIHSYQFLFDPKFERNRNPYDSQFRDVCLIYNQSLFRMLRLLGNEYEFVLSPDRTYAVQSLGETCNINCSMLTADWKGEEIEKFKFAADYEIKGLQNEYKQSGLGVPLIAIRKQGFGRSPAEKYYPPGLCFPVTAFLRPLDERTSQFHAVLELYDSTAVTHTQVENVLVPLESDLTTPLAYFLSNPRLNNLSTIGLLWPDELLISRFIPKPGDELARENSSKQAAKSNEKEKEKEKEKLSDKIQDKLVEYDLIDEPDEFSTIQQTNFQVNPGEKIDLTLVNHLVKKTEKQSQQKQAAGSNSLYGIYMMQPYDPNKIPVVMVHGLWSSPMTWMEMFNNLRSIPEIRDNYQFWFYFYPSAQPFWVSAAQLREDLVEVRRTLASHRSTPALDRMILIGHSMGGLVSRMQTVSSGDRFWQLVSNKPLEELHEAPEIKEKLEKWFYFTPDPSIDRVITIATPFRGSDYSNSVTQWFANKLIRLPKTLTSVIKEIPLKNNSSLTNNSLLKIETSIESLSPKNPLFSVLLSSETPPDVQFNNIIGLEHKTGLAKYLERAGDGIVEYKSAKIDGVQSEIDVPAPHGTVHTHPRSIMEVRRILLENLAETRQAAF